MGAAGGEQEFIYREYFCSIDVVKPFEEIRKQDRINNPRRIRRAIGRSFKPKLLDRRQLTNGVRLKFWSGPVACET